MKIKKIATFGVAAGLLAGGLVVASPATAEPVTSGYALVGSDTLQDSLNALTNGTSVTGANVRVTAAGIALGNYDAFGSPVIRTKTTGAYFTRPSGSGAGRDALRRSIDGAPYLGTVISGQVDIARSSSGPGSAANENGLLVYVPYARDAVAYAYKAADSAAADVLDSLTTAQLTAIYSASTPTTISGVTIRPRLPQSDSGTRSFFLGAISVGTVGAAVPASDNTPAGPAENDATVLGANEIIPFSAASWIAQANGAAPSTIGTTGVELGSPNGVAPFGGTVPDLTPSQTFYSAAPFGRDTYLIVEYARVDPSSQTYDAKLATLVSNSGGSNSLVTFGALPTTPGAVKAKFGFRQPNSTTPIRAYATL